MSLFDGMVEVNWVRQHGSEYLKKADRAGVLSDCFDVYRKERMKIDAPGWDWGGTGERPGRMHCPPVEALDALLELETDLIGTVVYVSHFTYANIQDYVALVAPCPFSLGNRSITAFITKAVPLAKKPQL